MPNQQRRRCGSSFVSTLLCLAAVHVVGAPVMATNICGPISGTLSPAGNPWIVFCDLSVEPGNTLIVDPGVELRFKAGWTLRILGTFKAIGTVAQPISIRSHLASPSAGDYGTIEVSGSANIAHANLLHGTGWSITGELSLDQSLVADQLDAGGLAALAYATGSTGAVTNSTFDNSGRPIALALDVGVSFSALQFATSHVARSIRVAGGSWTQSHTWTNAGVPYEITGLVFAPGTTQTFESGAIFKLAGSSLSFDNLQVLGTSATPVVFTAIDDDSWGGDTYGDGPGTPTAGDYGIIQVSGTALIQYALFRFGEGLEVTGHTDVSDSFFDQNSREALRFYPGSSGSVSTTFFNQNLRPLHLGTDADVTLSELEITSSHTNRAIWVEGGMWTHSRTWSDFGVPFELEGSGLSFGAQAAQILEPGVVFKIRPGGSIQFDELAVNGTIDQPVVFTAMDDDEYGGDIYGDGPQPVAAGYYNGLEFDGIATVDHAIFRFGSGILVIDHADFDHVTVESQLSSSPIGAINFDALATGSVHDSNFRDTCLPVSLQDSANPALSGLTAESQSCAEAVLVANGSWGIDRTWSDPGLPYYLPSGLTLPGGFVHSIAPGVVFKVETGVSAIMELGTPVQGTAGQPIVFTSFLDDTVAGDTNVDGPSVGASGDWGGLRVLAGSEWSHLDVRYAETGALLDGPTGSVRNSVFRFNGTGLRLEVSDPIPWTVTESQFVSNGIGVAVLFPEFANLGILSDMDPTNDGRNHFACNALNVDNEGSPGEVLVAENNWWGATPPDPSLFVGAIDADPHLTDWRSSALTLLRIDRSGSSDLALTWDDVAPACGYRVLRSVDPVSGFIDTSGLIPGASFIDVGGLVSPDDTYYLISIE